MDTVDVCSNTFFFHSPFYNSACEFYLLYTVQEYSRVGQKCDDPHEIDLYARRLIPWKTKTGAGYPHSPPLTSEYFHSIPTNLYEKPSNAASALDFRHVMSSGALKPSNPPMLSPSQIGTNSSG